MSNEPAALKVVNIDFNEIKDSFSTFLKSQEKFKDYNFSGSGLNVLLDVLAYNTHYTGFYSNMVANEMFLDSAVLRDSVVSHAKQLGYTPRSVTSAKAVVDLTVNFPTEQPGIPGDSGFLQVNTPFTCVNADGTSYIFRNTEAVKYEVAEFNSDGNPIQWKIRNLEVIEGRYANKTYIVDKNNPNQKFIIPEANVDTSTLKVRVQTSTTDISGYDTPWTLSKDANVLTETSKNYFLQEVEDGFYEVFFGDDIAGQGVKQNNVVILEYYVSNGDASNGCGLLDSTTSPSFTTSAEGSGTYTVSVVSPASGGTDREDKESVRYYAPRAYQAQERAVTKNDYEFILARDYAFADAVKVWGGEDNDPPVFGKVYVAVKPKSGTQLTDQERATIKTTILKDKNLVGIQPEVIDPDYVYIMFNTKVTYNDTLTTRSASEISGLVRDKMASYVDSTLERFDTNFRYSNFVTALDAVDPGVVATNTDIRLEKRFSPAFGTPLSYQIKFNNEFWHPVTTGCEPVVTSNGFYIFDQEKSSLTDPTSLAFLDDDGLGNIRTYTIENSAKRIINPTAGTIDYCTGVINLTNFSPTKLENGILMKVTVIPAERFGDISVDRDMLLVMDTVDTDSRVVSVSSYKTNQMIDSTYCTPAGGTPGVSTNTWGLVTTIATTQTATTTTTTSTSTADSGSGSTTSSTASSSTAGSTSGSTASSSTPPSTPSSGGGGGYSSGY